VKELRRHKERIESLVCVTAQHREMLDQVLALFGIDPEYDLNVMQENQSLAQVAANVLLRLDEVLEKEQPDWVLTQGDTTTAMIATLAGFYREAAGALGVGPAGDRCGPGAGQAMGWRWPAASASAVSAGQSPPSCRSLSGPRP